MSLQEIIACMISLIISVTQPGPNRDRCIAFIESGEIFQKSRDGGYTVFMCKNIKFPMTIKRMSAVNPLGYFSMSPHYFDTTIVYKMERS